MTRQERISRTVAWVALTALGVLLAWHLYHFTVTGLRAIAYPYELDYGEGIVWFQARQLLTGEAFGPIDRFPAIVFHYTPLFHLISGLLEATGIDGLAAGRIVSLVSTVAMAVMIGVIVRRVLIRSGSANRAATIAAAIAGLYLFACFPVKVWAPLMRVDMLAFALTLGGIWFGLRAVKTPRLIHAAAILFVLAVYTKQTMIAAPAAVFLVLLFYRPRTALLGIATCIVLGAVALATLTYATDGEFIRHIFLYNVNRLDPERLEWIRTIGFSHALLLMAALVGLVTTVPAMRRFASRRAEAAPEDAEAAILGCYLALTTLSLLLVLKSGSNVNYFIEWLAVVVIYAGFAVRLAIDQATVEAGRAARIGGMLAVLALCAQFVILPTTIYPAKSFTIRVERLAGLAERIRSADKPVIADDMVLLLRSGKPVLWEPAIFAELGAKGVWDEQPFIAMIEQRRFAMLVTVQERGGHLFDQRYNPAVAEAMARAYPRREKIAGLTLHLPE